MQKTFKYPKTMTPKEMSEAILKDARENGFKDFKVEVGYYGGDFIDEELVGNDTLDKTVTVRLTEKDSQS